MIFLYCVFDQFVAAVSNGDMRWTWGCSYQCGKSWLINLGFLNFWKQVLCKCNNMILLCCFLKIYLAFVLLVRSYEWLIIFEWTLNNIIDKHQWIIIDTTFYIIWSRYLFEFIEDLLVHVMVFIRFSIEGSLAIQFISRNLNLVFL